MIGDKIYTLPVNQEDEELGEELSEPEENLEEGDDWDEDIE